MPECTEGNLPPPLASVPPLLAPASSGSSVRPLLSTLLSLCLGFFIADALISVADDVSMVFLNVHFLAGFRLVVALFALLTAVVVYVLMAITPMIPKRFFVPVTLFNPAALLLGVLFMIYYFDRMVWIDLAFSVGQLVFGLWILYRVQGGIKVRWPLVPIERLGTRGFSWVNLGGFVTANVLLVPAVLVFLVVCTSLAVNHFSGGFMALRPSGFTVQMRKYVRDDGKTVALFPMAHVADAVFYRDISRAFPTNSIILLEGVTDRNNLLTNPISYKHMAASLGLAEQHEVFAPARGRKVRADVDISSFSTNTLAMLNLVMLVHANGMNPDVMQQFMVYPQSPQLQAELFDDLLNKRNAHLLDELNVRLAQTDNIIVPWGVAHMPGIAREILKDGFRLAEIHDYTVIRFGGGGTQAGSAAR